MKKSLLIAAVVTCIATFSGSAHAANAPSADTLACYGTGGYSQGVWTFSNEVDTPLGIGFGGCVWAAPEQAGAPTIAVPDLPPLLSGDTNPFDNVFWALGAVTGNIPDPAPAGWSGSVQLQGTGSFACGTGTLAGVSGGSFAAGSFPETVNYALDWSATFTGGVGTVTGTATAWDSLGNEVATRTITGTIAVADGGPAACDDSAPNSHIALHLVLS